MNLTKKIAEEKLLPLLNDDEDVKRGIPVTIFDRDGQTYEMKFVCWTKKLCVLNKGWYNFVTTHELIEEDSIKAWMFRHSQTNNLCFLLLKV